MATQVDCPPVQGSNAPKESGQPSQTHDCRAYFILQYSHGIMFAPNYKNPSSENYKLKKGKFLVKHSTSMTHTIDHKGKTHF